MSRIVHQGGGDPGVFQQAGVEHGQIVAVARLALQQLRRILDVVDSGLIGRDPGIGGIRVWQIAHPMLLEPFEENEGLHQVLTRWAQALDLFLKGDQQGSGKGRHGRIGGGDEGGGSLHRVPGEGAAAVQRQRGGFLHRNDLVAAGK